MTNTNLIQKANQGTHVAKNDKKTALYGLIKKMEPQIAKALPSIVTPERFTRIVTTALSSNPDLANCTPESFLGAIMQSAQLGLEPNTPLGDAYLIPYRNKGRLETQFQIGYKGLIDLAYRSGKIAIIAAHIVYENDDFECCYGLEPVLKHTPASGDRGKPVKVYGYFKTKDGGFGFEVMSMYEVKEHANQYSKTANSAYSPWKTNFNEMAKKTALKKALKYAPMSTDVTRAVSNDESIKSTISDDMSSEPNEFDFSGVQVVDVEDVSEADPGDK